MIDTSVFDNKTVAFYTLGCKLNFSETSAIGKSLIEQGYRKVAPHEPASLCIINTCSVTDSADKKCRQTITKAIKENPGAFVIVTGCYAQLKPDDITSIPNVDLVLGANDKFNIPDIIAKKTAMPNKLQASPTNRMTEFHHSYSSEDRTRHFLKVQDGCDYFCSYCTIPLARGRSRNGSIENLVKDAQSIAALGGKEIVLTGVNIGDFGHSTNESFIDLLKALEQVEGIERYRISSIEPNLLTDDIIALVAQSTKLMPHFHIPLQSGSDEILSLMKRKYSTDLFRKRVERIREIVPHAFIGVDVIAGTNGETEKYFQESFDFINSLEISQLHAFTYSERSGTQALKIPWKVDVEQRKNRTQKYINLSEKKLRAFYEKYIGTTQTALFEAQKSEDKMHGFTENYIKVEVPYQEELVNKLGSVKLKSILPNGNVAVDFNA